MAAGGEKEKKKLKKKRKEGKKVPVPSAKDPKEKGQLPRRSPAARSGDAIRESAKDGKSYAEILKAMKAKVNPQNAGAEVLSIQRTRREYGKGRQGEKPLPEHKTTQQRQAL